MIFCKNKISAVVATEAPEKDPVLYRGNLIMCAEKIRNLGYDGIEVHMRSVSETDQDKLLTYCRDNNFGVSAFATGMAKRIDGLCFLDDDAEKRRQAVQRVKEFIDFAAPFSAGVIIGSMRGTIPAGADYDEYCGRFAGCISELSGYAKRRKVNIFIEAINRYENNYLNTASETAKFISGLGTECVKINLDTFHMNIEESDMYGAVKSCGSMLGHIHLADNTRRYVGSGSIDFSHVFRAAGEIGYSGWYSVECLSGGDPKTALCRSLEHFKTKLE